MLRNISKVTFDLITKGVPKVKDRIIDNIFSGDRAFPSSYSLKPEIDNISTLRKKIEGIIDDELLTDLLNYFKSNEIDLQIPGELKRKIQDNSGDVAFFVGAGASKLLEYPTWDELANKAIEKLEEKRYISSYEKEIFQKEIKDPKIKLSLFETRLSKTETFQFYKDNLKKKKDQSSPKNIYKILVSDVFTNCIKLTTNVDSEFVNALIENRSLSQISQNDNIIISNNDQLSITPNDNRLETDFRSDVIYYLHGFIEKENNDLIFSTTNYLKHYFQEGTEKTSLKRFLEKLFEKCTVIFLGSSLEELQILEVIRKNKRPHYALMPTYFENLQFLELKAQYLKSLNLTILPYFLDNDGYSRLYSVLDAWKNELQTSSPKGVDYAKLIKDDIEKDENEEKILKSIREKPENYIYLLLQPIDTIKWFYKLKANGLLNSSYFQENSELLYQKISFLRRVIHKALDEKDNRLIKDLADLIKDDFLRNKIHLIDAQLYFRLIDIIKEFPITEIDNRLIDLLINEASFDSSVPLLPEKYSLFNKLFPSLINANETDLAFYLLEKYYNQNIINISHNGEKYDLGIYSEVTESTSFQEFAQSITQDKLITLSKLFSLSNLVKYKAFLMTIQSDSCNAGLTVISASEIQIKIYNIPTESHSKPDVIFEDIIKITIFDHTEDEILEKVNDKVYGYGGISNLGIQYFTGLFYHSIRNIFELESDTYNLNEDIFSLIISIVEKKIDDNFDQFIEYIQNPFYKDVNLKRILIFLLDKSWEAYQPLLKYILDNNCLFFHETTFEQDLRFLFRNKAALMTIDQKQSLLNTVLKSSSTIDNSKESPLRKEYFIYKWLSSVENDDFFKDQANKYSLILNLKPNHFDDIGRTQIMGFHSPVNYEELLIKEPLEVIEILKSVKGNWKENTSTDQLAQVFSNAIFNNTEHFKWILQEHDSIPYLHAYYIIRKFNDSFKNNVPISWDFILTFIEKYIQGDRFKSGNLTCGSEYNDSKNDIYSEVCSFISAISNDDKHSFPISDELLVLKILLNSVIPEKEVTKEVDFNYPTYTNNSPSGVKLHAIMQLSLKLARKSNEQVGNRWDIHLKNAFKKFLNGEYLSTYIIIGMYFRQFCYLDQRWALKTISHFDELSDTNWKGFFGGLVFQGAQGTKGMFEKNIKKHFLKALDNGFFQDKMISEGFINSITHYYYWEYFDSSDILISHFLNKSNAEIFSDFVKKIGFDKKNIDSFYKEEKHSRIIEKIKNLWDYILEKSDKKSCTFNLILWIRYIEFLLEKDYLRIKNVCDSLTSESYLYYFWEEINRLKDQGEDKEQIGYWISDIILTSLRTDLNRSQVPCDEVKKILEYLNILRKEDTISNCRQIKDILIEKYFCSFDNMVL